MIGQFVGRYRILRQLGEGGMGVVYEGVREDIGARAAIKVLRSELAQHEETAVRFFNEARAVNIIQNPAIVRVFDYGRLDDGTAYLAMEFLEGETLRDRMVRERRLSEPDSIRLGRQVAAGLAAAHEKQIIHRDLKPENVFVVPDAEAPGGERTKILDFGIAKLAASNLAKTRRNALMGTPLYMAPEQCRGAADVDNRADVYSLGIIIYEMLSGQPPFSAESVGAVMAMHMFNAPPPLQQSVPNLDRRLQQLVESMLSKDSRLRPSMTEVAQQLKYLGSLSSDVVSRDALAMMARMGEPPPPPVAGVPRGVALGGLLPKESPATATTAPASAGPPSGPPPIALAPTARPASPLAATVLANPQDSLGEPTELMKADAPKKSDWQTMSVEDDIPTNRRLPDPGVGALTLPSRRGPWEQIKQLAGKQPWVIPVICLVIATVLCVLVLTAGCTSG